MRVKLEVPLRGRFPDIKTSIDDIVAAGDTVAYRMTASGTDTGDFLGVAPTERFIRVTRAGWVRVETERLLSTGA